MRFPVHAVTPLFDETSSCLTHLVGIMTDATAMVDRQQAELAAREIAVQVRCCDSIFERLLVAVPCSHIHACLAHVKYEILQLIPRASGKVDLSDFRLLLVFTLPSS